MSLHKPFKPAAVCTIASRPLFTFLCPALCQQSDLAHRPQKRSFHQPVDRTAARPRPLSPQQMDNFFISALVQASSCRRHAKHTWAWQENSEGSVPHQKPRRKRSLVVQESVRKFQHGARSRGVNAAAQEEQTAPLPEPTQEYYRRLVDMYGPIQGHLETLKEEEEREAMERLEDETEEDGEKRHARTLHKPWPTKDETDSATIGELEELLEERRDLPDLAYEMYSSLSYPRAAYLHYSTIRSLLNCLAIVQHKRESSMLRYLSVIDDMKAANIPIHRVDWSTAIHFAGRCVRKVTNAEVQSALYIWREMEQEAGIQANNVTFNILFDIATKAGKYQLSQMILKEMETRKLKLDRYFRTGLILFFGLRGDGDGVRKAYRDLIEAGEIVDTAVMNCVITSLISAGEATAAEQVFLRMKQMHNEKGTPQPPLQNWRQLRELGITLNRAADQFRSNPDARKQMQDASPVGPDHGTYKILIDHYALAAGNIDRVTELLEEMSSKYGIHIRGHMFYTLFTGFQLHGGVRYSSWTKARLESTWRAFLLSLDEKVEGFFMDLPMVIKVIRAFAKVTTRTKTMEVWEEIQQRWQPSNADLEQVHARLRALFPTQV